ncbi:hypothetical protein MGN70_009877 [Eutypa lata]|nr:hypothetical protein MGN70_009877 [Eutypa lata]
MMVRVAVLNFANPFGRANGHEVVVLATPVDVQRPPAAHPAVTASDATACTVSSLTASALVQVQQRKDHRVKMISRVKS